MVGFWWRFYFHLLISTISIRMMFSMLSSFDITGTLGSITLGGATVIGALGDGTVIGTIGGATVGTSLGITFGLFLFVCYYFMLLKSFYTLSMAWNCLSMIVKGFFSPGLFILCINSLAALVACYFVDNPGMMRCCGNNSTTYACLFPLVFGV